MARSRCSACSACSACTCAEICLLVITLIVLLTAICMAICIFLLFRGEGSKEDGSKKPHEDGYVAVDGLTLMKVFDECDCPHKEAQPKRAASGKKSQDFEEKTDGPDQKEIMELVPNSLKTDNLVSGPLPEKTRIAGLNNLPQLRKANAEKRLIPKRPVVKPTFELRPNITKKVTQNVWKYHQRLVSVSLQRYPDDPNDVAFECSGFVLNQTFIVTVLSCVAGGMLSEIRVRHDSKYWSFDGHECVITRVIPKDKFALLHVVPHLNVTQFSTGYQAKMVWQDATSAGWKRDGRIYGMYDVTEWKSNSCELCPRALIRDNTTSCSRLFGDPLIVNNVLVGLRACGNEFIPILQDRI